MVTAVFTRLQHVRGYRDHKICPNSCNNNNKKKTLFTTLRKQNSWNTTLTSIVVTVILLLNLFHCRKNGKDREGAFQAGSLEASTHTFQEYTYKKITPCDGCSQVLRGAYLCSELGKLDLCRDSLSNICANVCYHSV